MSGAPEIESFESIGDITEFIQRHAEDYVSPISDEARLGGSVVCGLAVLLAGGIGAGLLGMTAGWPLLIGALVLGPLASETLLRRALTARRLSFQRSLERAPGRAMELLVARFQDSLALERRRMLGADSAWDRARSPLEQALDETRASMAYWSERVAQDDDPQLARQLATARTLEAKYAAALAEIDGRRDALLSFFGRCEAKLNALMGHASDLKESDRLNRLQAEGDSIIRDASQFIDSVVREFVLEAAEVGAALGGVERLQLKASAGDRSVDDLEEVADRILASAEEERAELDGLIAGVWGVSPPPRDV